MAPDELVVAFGAALRRAGLNVDVASLVSFTEALAVVGVDERDAVYWCGRATLIRRPEDRARYDSAFASFWDGVSVDAAGTAAAAPSLVAVEEVPVADDGARDGEDPTGRPPTLVRAGHRELLRHKDFGLHTAAERAETAALIAAIRVSGALRLSRRRRRGRGRGAFDLPGSLRRALRADGEVVDLRTKPRISRPRRIVLLCDISGSMAPYSRPLLRFMHAAAVARRAEAFAVGTRLTRITVELRDRDPEAALAAVGRAVVDWSGGTRLGESLHDLNREWSGVARGAVVVIVSDGWDRGDPEVLAEQMARLHRVAFKVVWVNPHKASPGYAPLARGMAAALPHVDAFVEGHNVAALEDLAAVIAS